MAVDFFDKVLELTFRIWLYENAKLNSDKCKELRISFARNQQEFQPILVNGQELEVVQSAKLLGVTVTNNLSWNEHINDIVKKASERWYFLVQLKGQSFLAKIYFFSSSLFFYYSFVLIALKVLGLVAQSD